MNGTYQIEMVNDRFAGQPGVAEISALVATPIFRNQFWRISPTTG